MRSASILILVIICLVLALQWEGSTYPRNNSRIIGLMKVQQTMEEKKRKLNILWDERWKNLRKKEKRQKYVARNYIPQNEVKTETRAYNMHSRPQLSDDPPEINTEKSLEPNFIIISKIFNCSPLHEYAAAIIVKRWGQKAMAMMTSSKFKGWMKSIYNMVHPWCFFPLPLVRRAAHVAYWKTLQTPSPDLGLGKALEKVLGPDLLYHGHRLEEDV